MTGGIRLGALHQQDQEVGTETRTILGPPKEMQVGGGRAVSDDGWDSASKILP